MATTKFNTLVIRVARRLQEPKANDATYLAGTVGDRYTAVLVAGYINNAIRQVVLEKVQELGEYFADVMPDMTRSVSPLALAAGLLLQPGDFLYPLGLRTTGNVLFRLLKGRDVTAAVTGIDPTLAGTATEPTYYIEGASIITLGLLSGDVELRYIIKHTDITISEVAAGNGKWYTGSNGAYTAATKTLVGTFNSNLVASDVSKQIMFRTATKVYHATISSRVSNTSVTVMGTDLPAGNIAANDILQMLISDIAPNAADLQLSEQWWSEVEERAMRLGILDAQRGLLQQTT